jgi:uncharacterized protein DUF4397
MEEVAMSSRWLTCLFAATALFSVACDDSSGLSDSQAANVRVVHASATPTTVTSPIDVAVNGQVATGNAGIEFGGTSECVRVDADTPDLAIRAAGTATVLATPGPFTAGGRNTVVLSGPAATLRVTVIDDPLTPPLAAGRARIRVFNGRTLGPAMDVTVTPVNQPGSAQSASNIAQASATGWLEIPAGAAAVRLRNAGTTTDVDFLNVLATSGQELTLVAVDPATGSGDLRWVFTTPCPAP